MSTYEDCTFNIQLVMEPSKILSFFFQIILTGDLLYDIFTHTLCNILTPFPLPILCLVIFLIYILLIKVYIFYNKVVFPLDLFVP